MRQAKSAEHREQQDGHCLRRMRRKRVRDDVHDEVGETVDVYLVSERAATEASGSSDRYACGRPAGSQDGDQAGDERDDRQGVEPHRLEQGTAAISFERQAK